MGKKKKYSKKELETFEQILLEKRAELIKELGYIEDTNMFQSQKEQAGELSGYANHLADAASDFTTLETNFDLAEREGKYLVYLEEALERVKQETYGVCKDCEELIPKPRLEVVPTATRCVDCKQETKKVEAKEQQAQLAQMYLAQHRQSK